MSLNNTPWVLKYSPVDIDSMVLTNELKNMFNDMINNHSLNNISLVGQAGIGKSTLAKILVSKLNVDSRFQPCSMDGSIDMIKTSIKNFCEIVPKNKFKVVILDEADQISQQGQMALRNIIVEAMPNTRFILTANYQDKIIPAIQSRCTPIKLEFTPKDVMRHCINILNAEGIKYTKETITDFYYKIICKKYPDIRSIIEQLQLMSSSGELKLLQCGTGVIDNEVIKFILEHDSVNEIRQYLIQNETLFSADYVKLGQELFNVYQNDLEAMLIISDALWKMSYLLDKEIQFTAMIIRLLELRKKK